MPDMLAVYHRDPGRLDDYKEPEVPTGSPDNSQPIKIELSKDGDSTRTGLGDLFPDMHGTVQREEEAVVA